MDDEGNVALGGGDGLVEQYFQRDGETFARGSAIDVRLGGEPADVRRARLPERHGGRRDPPRRSGARHACFVWPIAEGGTPTQFETDYLDVPTVALLGPDADLLVVAGRDTATDR